MKVFMLIRFLDYSGAPTMFMWVAEAMRRLGHEVVVCTYNTQRTDIKLPIGVKWIDFTSEKRGFFGIVKRVKGLIRETDADVSISFQLDANVYNILACKGLKTRSVVCERNDPYKPGYYKLRIFKPLFGWADGAVYQLPKAREYYDNVKVPVAIIPNPFVAKTDLRCESHDKRKNIISSHGRLDIFQKRQDVLIDAFAMLLRDYPNYELQIFGSQWPGTNDEARLHQQIKRLGIEENARLMGVSKNPQQDIKESKVWVSTSDFEGISNALMDAMAIGMPIVATDCSPGGAAFMIKNKENGLLVNRGDAKAVYEGMKYMIEHPDEADEMGRKAAEIQEKLDGDKIAGQWENYLKELTR